MTLGIISPSLCKKEMKLSGAGAATAFSPVDALRVRLGLSVGGADSLREQVVVELHAGHAAARPGGEGRPLWPDRKGHLKIDHANRRKWRQLISKSSCGGM